MTDRFQYHPKDGKQFPIPNVTSLQEAILWASVDYELSHEARICPGDNILDQNMFDDARKRVESGDKNKLVVCYHDGIAATPAIVLGSDETENDSSASKFGFDVSRNEHDCVNRWILYPLTDNEVEHWI